MKPLETIADRLARYRKERKLTPEQVAELTGMALPTVYAHENGSRKPNKQNLIKYATLYRTTVDDLLRGIIQGAYVTQAEVVGYVGIGGVITLIPSEPGQALELVDAPPGVGLECSAARIRGDYLYPFRDSWFVFWSPDGLPGVAEECIGELCVVKLRDGRLILANLSRGTRNGLYRLDAQNSAPIHDVAVEWAARVLGFTMPKP